MRFPEFNHNRDNIHSTKTATDRVTNGASGDIDNANRNVPNKKDLSISPSTMASYRRPPRQSAVLTPECERPRASLQDLGVRG